MRCKTTLTLALLASLSLPLGAMGTIYGQDDKVPTVEEPETEVEFPISLIVLPKTEKRKEVKHDLSGMGVRVKTKFFMDFEVYALGFYMDEERGLAALKEPAANLSVSKLEESKEFRKALLGDGFGKTMRLVMVRDVDADDMAEAFDDVLWPRMKDRSEGEKELSAAKIALKKFKDLFEKEAEEDQVLDFTWIPGGEMYAVVDGKRHPVVKSAALCWALFDAFVGDDPISKDAKENIFTALREKLHPATR
ncbi:MAG: chalcone isomerase family protein [Planctomycetota bacterium]|nr:chalcone isomerase family protein [Planctomycetota bacterium]